MDNCSFVPTINKKARSRPRSAFDGMDTLSSKDVKKSPDGHEPVKNEIQQALHLAKVQNFKIVDNSTRKVNSPEKLKQDSTI